MSPVFQRPTGETMNHGLLDITRLVSSLDSKTIGTSIEVHDTVGSTNTMALDRADQPGSDGLVIFAERQTAGRGRLGRTWESPRGASILCTVLLHLEPDSSPAKTILLWAALGVRAAVLESCNVETVIKWPNDIMASGKKLCGILIESRPLAGGLRAFAIGVGLNCLQHARHFPVELIDRATSLDLESEQPVDRLKVAVALIRALDNWHSRAIEIDPAALKAEWSASALPLGKRLRLCCQGRSFRGSLIELDPESGIVVQLEEGGRRLFDPWSTTIEEID